MKPLFRWLSTSRLSILPPKAHDHFVSCMPLRLTTSAALQTLIREVASRALDQSLRPITRQALKRSGMHLKAVQTVTRLNSISLTCLQSRVEAWLGDASMLVLQLHRRRMINAVSGQLWSSKRIPWVAAHFNAPRATRLSLTAFSARTSLLAWAVMVLHLL